jgi:hypothetical protein
VNLALEGLLSVLVASGLLSWVVPLHLARPFTAVHAVAGFGLLWLAPAKIRGSVRTGFRRRRRTRWLSSLFGTLVVGTIGLAMLHATGLWYGVGYWSALWTHLLLGFAVLPLAAWHVWSRPPRPTVADLDRRALLTGGALAAGAVATWGTQEVVVRLAGLDGAQRAGTGSHERSSFDPDHLPVVSWLDDTIPERDLAGWLVTVDGAPLDLADLARRSSPCRAVLDCTGGWRSAQDWDAVPLAVVLPPAATRSIRVTSATGYSRLFARSDAAQVYLCTGYGGQPLRPGHGAPLRIVAPGRRGPWWVKWVTSIETTDRPAWLQLPFPPT